MCACRNFISLIQILVEGVFSPTFPTLPAKLLPDSTSYQYMWQNCVAGAHGFNTPFMVLRSKSLILSRQLYWLRKAYHQHTLGGNCARARQMFVFVLGPLWLSSSEKSIDRHLFQSEESWWMFRVQTKHFWEGMYWFVQRVLTMEESFRHQKCNWGGACK